ncbi:unnamed protein product [Brassica rapa subsp. trilocularis]
MNITFLFSFDYKYSLRFSPNPKPLRSISTASKSPPFTLRICIGKLSEFRNKSLEKYNEFDRRE